MRCQTTGLVRADVDAGQVEDSLSRAFEALHVIHYEVHGLTFGVVPGEQSAKDLLLRIAEINTALVEIERQIGDTELESEASDG